MTVSKLTTSVQVTVVVVNWNAGDHLGRALAALQQQTYASFKVIVVDNASSDASQAVVEQLADPRFSLIQLDRNLGFARANNLAVERSAASPWIALLNPDAIPNHDWLERLIDATARHPDAGAFGSALISATDPTLWDGTGDCYHVSGRAYRRDHGLPRVGAYRSEGLIFSPCAAAALYTRSAWQAARGFDEAFFCYLEDVDLGFRMQLLGFKSVHVPQAICYHVGSAMTGRRSDFSVYHGQRNLVWVFVKNMPGPLLCFFLPLHILVNCAAVILFAARGQFGTVLRAKMDALRGLGGRWRERRVIQSHRVATLREIWRALDKRTWLQ